MKEAKVQGVTLPTDWSVRALLEELRETMTDIQQAALKTAASLRHSGTHIDTFTSSADRQNRFSDIML